MSGSKDERATAAGETVEPPAESAAADAPADEAEVEMSAAEALAQATEAAAAESTATPASAEPEAAAAEPAPEAPAPEAAEPAEPAEPQPTEAEEADPATTAEPEATATAEPETAEQAGPPSEGTEPEPAAEPEPIAATAETDSAETAVSEPPAAAEASPQAAETEPEKAAPENTESPAPEAAADAPAEKDKAPAKPAPPPVPDRPELRAVREALTSRQPLEGRVIGWNNGGFHLALGDLSAFCPRSEIEIGEAKEPESYLDQTFEFRVLRLQGKGRRIVVSRAAHLRNEKSRQRSVLRKKLQAGVELTGTVASLTDFGAFVDLGGTQGLVHVSEISHRRVEHPSDVLSEGQEVQVKVLKVEQGGRRISLSMRALEPDPWKDLADRFPQGAVVKGTVEKANQIGAFIELAPGLTGLLPARSMSIPRETTPARAYPPGKEVSVQIVSVDPRRQRISLALEGSGLEGSRSDFQDYQKRHRKAAAEGDGFNALASAFRRLQDD